VWLEQYVEKLERKHDVAPEEVEALFFAKPKYRFVETGNVERESLYSAMGRTEEGRYLIVFFIHKQDGRALIISARPMDHSEKKRYERK
jgi:uncharacterized DUF497 family protein